VTDWEYDAGRRTLTVATGPRPVGEETAIVLATGRPVATDSPRAETAPRCLARRARVTRRGIGRVRLRATRASLRRAGVAAPRRASRTRLAFCVRGGGRVVAALDRRGRIRLVATTARGHRRGRLHPRARATVLRRVHPGRAVRGRGVVAASRRSRILFGVSRRRVSFVAVSASARPKLQRALLRRARLRR
jgi:hypothetical protein